MQGDDRTDERRQINNEHHVVSFHGKGTNKLFDARVREKIKDVLKLVDDDMVDG